MTDKNKDRKQQVNLFTKKKKKKDSLFKEI